MGRDPILCLPIGGLFGWLFGCGFFSLAQRFVRLGLALLVHGSPSASLLLNRAQENRVAEGKQTKNQQEAREGLETA